MRRCGVWSTGGRAGGAATAAGALVCVACCVGGALTPGVDAAGADGVATGRETGAAGGAGTGVAAGRVVARVETAGCAGADGVATGASTCTGADGAAGAAGAAGLAAAGGAAAGFAGAAGLAGAGGATVGAPRCVMAFSTSPGLEIFERSNFVLISSSLDRDAALLAPFGFAASDCLAKCAFTRSASSTSMALECVFFSVTPTNGNTSRIALLLTSSSRARSLIRIFGCIPLCNSFRRGPQRGCFCPNGVVAWCPYLFIPASRTLSYWLLVIELLKILRPRAFQ